MNFISLGQMPDIYAMPADEAQEIIQVIQMAADLGMMPEAKHG